VSAVVFVAHYYSVGKGLFAGLLEAASSSLADGSPSGATVVSSADLTSAVAFQWWHSSVIMERLAQACGPSRSARASEAALPRRLPPRLDALLDFAARRALRNRPGSSADSPGLVFVFSHGGDGTILSADRTISALSVEDRLEVRRGAAGGRKPSVLAAYIDGVCVTEHIGKIASLPPPTSNFGATTPGRALVAYLASQGFGGPVPLANVSKLVVAARGEARPVEYDATEEKGERNQREKVHSAVEALAGE
jgi:hypothetical protein